jgi:8-oxo-dGTP diphosphatase
MEPVMVGLYRKLRLPIRIKQKLIWLLNPKYCVGVLAYIPHPNDPKKVLLADHPYRGLISWSLPGGFVGRNEDPQSAIKREMREELGVEVEVKRLLHAALSEFGISLDLVYLCRLVDDQPKFRFSSEIAKVDFYNPQGLPEEQMYRQHVSLIRHLAHQNPSR